jgi:hypothetical protein
LKQLKGDRFFFEACEWQNTELADASGSDDGRWEFIETNAFHQNMSGQPFNVPNDPTRRNRGSWVQMHSSPSRQGLRNY